MLTMGPTPCLKRTAGTRDLRLIKARVLINLPRRPPEGPRGERYQYFEEIVGAFRTQTFRSEFMGMGFHWILVVSCIGSLAIGVGARVRGVGVNKLRAKIGGNSLGEGGVY
jgi:hypothetical protein